MSAFCTCRTLLLLLCLLTFHTPSSAQLVADTVRADTPARPDIRALDDVSVTARKPLIERRADRTVFNVDASISAAGSDAYEMLRKVPGVSVRNEAISIAGKSTVAVMINDRLVQLSGDELVAMLKSIPADNLARIEIITTPPAKYDAEGSTGLIHFVTKRNRQDGLNGNLTGHYAQRLHGIYGLTGQFNWRSGRLNVFGNGNAYNGYLQPVQRTTTIYPDTRMELENVLKTQNVFNRLVLGADYSLNDRMVVGMQGTFGHGGWSYNADDLLTTRAINTRTAALDSTLVTIGHNTDRGIRKVLNLNWEWKIDSSGRKLSVDVDYFNRVGDRTRDFTTAQFLPDGRPTGFQSDNRTGGRQEIDIRAARLDAVWPLKETKISAGLKASVIHNTSDNLFTFLQGGSYRRDHGKTNSFDYKESTQAAYLSAERKVGKWSGQAGLRAEYTQTRGHSPTISRTAENAYFQIFPTAYLQYDHNEAHAFNINYSRRIERPSFWLMNPFRSYFTALSYHEGNPFLQPSFTNNVELSYILRSRYTFNLFASRQRDMTMSVPVLDTPTRSYHFTQINTGRATSAGFFSQATFNPLRAWECRVSGSVFYRQFSSDYFGSPADYSRLSAYLESSSTFTLNKERTWLAEIGMNYNTPQQSGFEAQRANGAVSAGIRRMLLQKALTISLTGEDLFRTDRSYITNSFNGTIQEAYYDQRAVRLAVSWKFGNSQVKGKRERAVGADEARRAQ